MEHTQPLLDDENMVITAEGCRLIQNISVGDQVLTHLNRFRPVVHVSSAKTTDVYESNSILTGPMTLTGDQPVFARKQMFPPYYSGDKSTLMYSIPWWIDAKDLDETFYIGVSLNQEALLPDLLDDYTTVCQIGYTQLISGDFNIDQRIVNLPKGHLRAFLQGYLNDTLSLSAEGYITFTHLDKHTALTLAHVVAKAYEVGYNLKEVADTGYDLSFCLIPHLETYDAFVMDGHIWCPAAEVLKIPGQYEKILLTIAEDKSYFLGTVAVHDTTSLY